MADDATKWLDSWCTIRRLDTVERKPSPPQEPARPLPYEHSRYIMQHGKKAYRQWIAAGCPAETVTTKDPHP